MRNSSWKNVISCQKFPIWLVLLLGIVLQISEVIHASPARIQSEREKSEKYFFEGKYFAALDYFGKISAENPEDYRAHRLAGDASIALGKYSKATDFYRRAQEFSPNPELDWFRIGQANYLDKNGSQALKYLKRAAPKVPLALFYIGLSEYKINADIPKTIKYWEEYVATSPPDEKVVREAIEILKRKKTPILAGTNKEGAENAKKDGANKGQDQDSTPSPPPLVDKHVSPTKLLSPN